QLLRKQFDLSQPAMSHHFKILRQCRVVTTKKRGKHVYYSLNRELLGNYLERFLQDIRNGGMRDE
ncbi:MAG: ArsR family transcriptional regulator, partial [Candidatus Aquicultor sp.]